MNENGVQLLYFGHWALFGNISGVESQKGVYFVENLKGAKAP